MGVISDAGEAFQLSTMGGGVFRTGASPSNFRSVVLSVFVFLSLICSSYSLFDSESFLSSNSVAEKLIWCTINVEEQYKCGNLSRAIERDRQLFGEHYFAVECFNAFDKDECMLLIGNDKADVTLVDSGDLFFAGRFHSLMPFLQEMYKSGTRHSFAVAVVKKGSNVGSEGLRSLRNTRACFPTVGTYAGWVLPINMLMKEGGLEVADCNNHVKSVINYFGPSCAPNALLDRNNPIGDNSDKICELCTGGIGLRCSSRDPYAGYTGALRCLLETGDIAFLKHTTVPYVLSTHPEFSQISSDRFELLCRDGSRRVISDYLSCNWGKAPPSALVTSTAKTESERKKYQKFFQKIIQHYSNLKENSTLSDNTRYPDGRSNERDLYGNPIQRDQYGNIIQKDRYGNPISNPYDNDYSSSSRWNNSYSNQGYSTTSTTTETYNNYNLSRVENFEIFDSSRYGSRTDLLLEDTTRNLEIVPEDKKLVKDYLGPAEKPVLAIRDCPVKRFILCVTSEAEMIKCVKMRTALKAQLLKPDMSCYRGHSHINCMQAISAGNADGIMLDAADIWEGARHYSLEPFLSEVYGLGETSYYAVAVTKEEDPSTEITYLKGKNTCHSGINTAAGWLYPLAYLIANGWIRPYGCDAAKAAAEWFSRSCVPGAMSPEYNMGVPHAPLCRLCHGSSFSFCRRDASEAYYGNIGALRCLVEGGGDVAFVRHLTVAEAAGGRKKEWWARNTLKDDFQLLCPDGTRGSINDFKRCNLGKVPANAMVTRGGDARNETEIAAYTNLFLYAQHFYGALSLDEFSFSMFSSPPPYFDLIFSDGTRRLQPLKGKMRRASQYLGHVFMRAHKLTDCSPSTSSAISMNIFNVINLFLIITSVSFLLKLNRLC